MKIAILGGTGQEGQGLALRWAAAGHEIVIGSRQAAKAERIAAELNEKLGRPAVTGLGNGQAAAAGEIAVLTVPYAAHGATLAAVTPALQGKILIDVTVPLDPENTRRVSQPEGGSAAQEAEALLGPAVRVVGAFHNISHTHLQHLDRPIDSDVLVCGNDREAKQLVIALAAEAGMRAIDAGPIENSAVAEGLTSVLINVNVQHKVKGAGIRITGLPD